MRSLARLIWLHVELHVSCLQECSVFYRYLHTYDFLFPIFKILFILIFLIFFFLNFFNKIKEFS